MSYDYHQNCHDTLAMKTFIATNLYNRCGDLDFNVPRNELLCKLYTYTISQSYNVSMAATRLLC